MTTNTTHSIRVVPTPQYQKVHEDVGEFSTVTDSALFLPDSFRPLHVSQSSFLRTFFLWWRPLCSHDIAVKQLASSEDETSAPAQSSRNYVRAQYTYRKYVQSCHTAHYLMYRFTVVSAMCNNIGVSYQSVTHNQPRLMKPFYLFLDFVLCVTC